MAKAITTVPITSSILFLRLYLGLPVQAVLQRRQQFSIPPTWPPQNLALHSGRCDIFFLTLTAQRPFRFRNCAGQLEYESLHWLDRPRIERHPFLMGDSRYAFCGNALHVLPFTL